MVSVHANGECRIRYEEIEMAEECLECKKEYEENYTFFVMLCKCGCGDYFRICEECSHMFYRCDCGCEGNYNKCSQPPLYGNILVSFCFIYLV